MKYNRSAETVPAELMCPADARAIFNYLFKKARLWPEYKMSPREGEVRRVVLFSDAFNDKTVKLLEQIPGVKSCCSSLQEMRLVCTKITPEGVARMKQLFSNSEVNVVPCDEWEKNVDTGNPEFDLKSGKFREPSNPRSTPNSQSSESRKMLLERYG
jgi:hypothetical protein